jgi:hypothetical protein
MTHSKLCFRRLSSFSSHGNDSPKVLSFGQLRFVIESRKRLAQSFVFRPLDSLLESRNRLAPSFVFRPLDYLLESRNRLALRSFFRPLVLF